MNKELTKHEKRILYNIVFDKYYTLGMQSVSKEIRKEYLQSWEETLGVMIEKMKQQGWNDYGD